MRIHLFLYLIAFSCTIARVSRTKLIRYWAFPTIGLRVRVHDVHAVHPMDHRVSETSTALDWAPPDRGIDWGIHGDARRDRDGGEETGPRARHENLRPVLQDHRPASPHGSGELLEKCDAEVIGEHDGFIAPPPFGILHMDSMRIYNSRVRGEDERRAMRSLFGISVLLGTSSAPMAHEAGCRKMGTSLPSTMETSTQRNLWLITVGLGSRRFASLVRVQQRTSSTCSLGGVGTRMNGDLEELLGKWGSIVRRQAKSGGY